MKLKLLKIRFSIAFKILFNPNLHWIFIYLNDDELNKHFMDELDSINSMNHKLAEYNSRRIIKDAANAIDDDDLILEKAAFEGEAQIKHGKIN